MVASRHELPNLPVPGDVERQRGRAVLEGGEPKVQGRGGLLREARQRVLQTKCVFFLFFFFFKTVNLGKRRAPCPWQNKATLCHKYMPKKSTR